MIQAAPDHRGQEDREGNQEMQVGGQHKQTNKQTNKQANKQVKKYMSRISIHTESMQLRGDLGSSMLNISYTCNIPTYIHRVF